MRVIWPEAKAYYLEGHVLIKIDEKFYDISGVNVLTAAQHEMKRPLSFKQHKPHAWRTQKIKQTERETGFRGNNSDRFWFKIYMCYLLLKVKWKKVFVTPFQKLRGMSQSTTVVEFKHSKHSKSTFTI